MEFISGAISDEHAQGWNLDNILSQTSIFKGEGWLNLCFRTTIKLDTNNYFHALRLRW